MTSGPYSANTNFTGSDLPPVSPPLALPIGQNRRQPAHFPFLPTLSSSAMGVLFGLVSRNCNVSLAIQALEVGRPARSSEPKIVTVENATAEISRGFEVPLHEPPTADVSNVQFKDALLRLQVTPNVIYEEGRDQDPNEDPGWRTTSRTSPGPSTAIRPSSGRRTETEVVVREGEKLVIGGVMLDNSSKTIRGVPLLSSDAHRGMAVQVARAQQRCGGARDRAHPVGGLLRPDGGEVARVYEAFFNPDDAPFVPHP